MAGYLNLVELIQGKLTGDFANRMAAFLGENGEQTASGIKAFIPGFLSKLDRAASTSEGARRVTAAVDDADEGVFDNVAGTFVRTSASEPGSSLLNSIFGAGEVSGLSDSLSRVSGLPSRSANSLIGMLAPIVFAILKRSRRLAGGLDIPSLLASQRQNIASAVPVGMADEVHAGPRPVTGGRATADYVEPHRRSAANWILPLFLLAGGIGLLWYWAARPRSNAFVGPTTVQAGKEENPNLGAAFSLQMLTNKYRRVFEEARERGIRITDFSEQNGKLILKGTAPSAEAAAKLWDEIHRINPAADDIEANFDVAADAAAVPAEPAPEQQSYTVKRGDTLSSISREFYGDATEHMRIFNANREQIHNQNQITPGMELIIPGESKK